MLMSFKSIRFALGVFFYLDPATSVFYFVPISRSPPVNISVGNAFIDSV